MICQSKMNKYKNKNRAGIMKKGNVYYATAVIDNIPYTEYFRENECKDAKDKALQWWYNQKRIAQLLELDFKESEW